MIGVKYLFVILATAYVSAAPVLVSDIYRRAAAAVSDVDVLNFACLLEDLENKFYKQCTTQFKKEDYTKAGFNAIVFDEFKLINDHENTHFLTLQSTIKSVFGANKLQPECAQGCEYNFPLKSAADCVNIGAILERTGVSAYDGAIRFVEVDIKNAGAAIATIEGRHAAFLNLALKKLPVPNAFDTPLGIRPIFSLAAQFVKKCPRTIPIVPFPLITVKSINGDVGEDITVSFAGNLNSASLDKVRITMVFGLAQKNFKPKTIKQNGNIIEAVVTVPDDVKKFGEVIIFAVGEDKPVSVADDSAVIGGPGTLLRQKVVVDVVA
ncbi:hypothetical protein HK096_007666 [Nowakowskiella sp. JEL0078]|nr:hypothetical protein HK096_007666 [Nowakowskiella sp. JEL0078]